MTTREYPIVTCMKHGSGPGYCVCLHVAEGVKPSRIVRATEDRLGEALCRECIGKRLTADDLVLWCAGCLWESVGRC